MSHITSRDFLTFMVQLRVILREFVRQEISCQMVRSEKKRLRNTAKEEPQPTEPTELTILRLNIILYSPKTKIKSNGNIHGSNFVTG